ncbi:MAG: aerolysin family beta-barrel pore-forming toxin [Clostridiaceae bacterium]|nr:aerolysin family beta-barrel pore-forming toxin [Clostridiaceae bacterium]
MVNFKKIAKNTSLTALVLAQVMAPMSSVFPASFRSFLGSQVVHAASVDPSGITPKDALIYGETDTEQLKAAIFKDPDFISTYAGFADKLGFGWCGGTRSQYVGEDFDFSKSGDDYILQAHYNANDPYASGYRASDRLKMTISNVKFYLDPNSIKYDPMQASDPKPFLAGMVHVNNGGDTPITASPSLSYQIQTSKAHTSTYGFSENVGLKETLETSGGIFGFVGTKHTTELSFNFNASQGWTDTQTDGTNGTLNSQTTVTVPPHSTVNVSMQSLKLNYSAGYTANVYVSYTITFHGFLRWSGNARTDHPQDRPTVDVTFGDKDKNISAVEDIMSKYNHRNISGFSNWDWTWIENNYGASVLQDNLAYIMSQRGAVNVGKFEFKDSNDITITVDKPVPYSGTQQGADAVQQYPNPPQTGAQSTEPTGTTTTKDASIKILEFNCPIVVQPAPTPEPTPTPAPTPEPTLVKIPQDGMGISDDSWSSRLYEAIDNDPSTWCTAVTVEKGILLDIHDYRKISRIKYLPKQESYLSDAITDYDIYVSTDNVNFTKVASGKWANDATEKTAQFDPVDARFIRIVPKNMSYVSVAELNVYGN